MWVSAVYHQVSLFSLKPASATSTGGTSLLIPTPYSIKMALLNVALKTAGRQAGAELFPLIRDLTIALSPPRQFVVNNCFVGILKPWEDKKGGKKDEEAEKEVGYRRKGMFIPTVATRQYVQYSGPLGLALEAETEDVASILGGLLLQIAYFGKRGSLFQVDGPPITQKSLPTKQGYLKLVDMSDERPKDYTLQLLDDCASSMTFAHADIYSDEPIKLGVQRILRHIVLPYQLTRSSRAFSLYERLP